MIVGWLFRALGQSTEAWVLLLALSTGIGWLLGFGSQRILAAATRDGLTNLMNNREFHAQLDLLVGRARSLGEPLSLLYLDVDNFKAVNDTLGHAAGDQVLIAVGEALRRNCRRSGLAQTAIYKYGLGSRPESSGQHPQREGIRMAV